MMQEIPERSINCMITSPPYYKVRDYGIEGQWGQEKDPMMYLDKLGRFMRQVRRILTDDGIAWINIGDCIIKGGWFGFPEMFFTNCRIQGWRSVSKPVWIKRNAMPSSTGKRLSPKYEPVYGFAKSDDYYFDLDSVRIPVLTQVKPFNLRVREAKKGRLDKKYGSQYKATESEKLSHDSKGVKKQDAVGKSHYMGFNGRYDHSKMIEKGKNPGDILDITVKPFKDAHFATFPPELPEILIKCSCPENGWVLDPFFGGGTVGLVAEKLKRKWLGIELNPKYVRMAKKRIGI